MARTRLLGSMCCRSTTCIHSLASVTRLAAGKSLLQVSEDALAWRHRWPLICDVLAQLDTDVLCLQEVNHHEQCFLPALQQLGYDSAHVICLS